MFSFMPNSKNFSITVDSIACLAPHHSHFGSWPQILHLQLLPPISVKLLLLAVQCILNVGHLYLYTQ